MRYEEILEALVIVDKLKSKKHEHPDKDLILYAERALSMREGDYNYMYPLLRQGLSKQFKDHIEKEWVRYVKERPGHSVLDIGAGDGAYLDALPSKYRKTAIDNKSLGELKECNKIIGSFPKDMPLRKYDLILMNEFLHLFKLEEALELIEKAKEFLNEGGSIIVCENLYDNSLQYRLDKLGGGTLHNSKDLGLANTIFIDRHYIGEINERL